MSWKARAMPNLADEPRKSVRTRSTASIPPGRNPKTPKAKCQIIQAVEIPISRKFDFEFFCDLAVWRLEFSTEYYGAGAGERRRNQIEPPLEPGDDQLHAC